MIAAAGNGLVEVWLLGLPVDVQARAEEHHAELLREFSHIAHSEPELIERIPDRLLRLVGDVRMQYEPFAGRPREEIDAARAAGRAELDVCYQVPPQTREVALQLSAELEEADRFCRSGALLTLATPPELRRFRSWFLEQFVRQVDGDPPTPWREYAAG